MLTLHSKYSNILLYRQVNLTYYKLGKHVKEKVKAGIYKNPAFAYYAVAPPQLDPPPAVQA